MTDVQFNCSDILIDVFDTYLIDDNAKAWKLRETGERAWLETTSPAKGAAANSKPVYKEHFTHTTTH